MLSNEIISALQENRELIYKFAEFIPSPVSIHCHGKFVFMNRLGLELIGAESLDQVLDKKTTEIVHPDSLQYLSNRMIQAATSDEPVSAYEVKIIGFNGNVIYAEFNSRRFLIQNEVYVLSILQDITDRIIKESDLRTSRENFRILSELTTDSASSLTIEQDGSFVRDWTTDKLLNEYGYTFDEIDTFQKWAKMVHPDDLPEFLAAIERFQRENKVSVDLRIITKNGEVKWVNNSVFSYVDQISGKPKLLSAIKDITFRKNAESKVKESEEALRRVVQNMPVMLVAFDENYDVIVWNRNCEEVTGYKADEVLRTKKFINKLIPDQREMKKLQIIWERNDKTFVNAESEITRKDGEKRTILWTDISVSFAIPGWTGWAIGFDISEIKAIEKDRENLILILQENLVKLEQKNTDIQQLNLDLEKSERSLIELNANKDKFFSIISHDLKNPFSALLNLTDFLTAQFYKLSLPELNDSIANVNVAARRVYRLLENLLYWSRINQGKMQFIPEVYHLNDIVKMTVGYIKSIAENKNISIQNTIDEDIEIYADINMIELIFRNLINNAIKFCNPGGNIHISAIRSDSGVIAIVEDDGVGIPEQVLPCLFRIDTKLSTPGTSGEEGSGLGLILCKEFIQLHKGKIEIESQENIGSRFILHFPAKN